MPQVILKYENYKFYWDCTILTNKIINFKQPDILLGDKTNKEAALIDKAIPLTYNLPDSITEKQCKYQELAFEIRQQLQRKKIVIHLVLLAMGVIRNMLNLCLTKLNLPPCLLSHFKEGVILKTCSIMSGSTKHLFNKETTKNSNNNNNNNNK